MSSGSRGLAALAVASLLLAASCLSPDAFFVPTISRPLDAPAGSVVRKPGSPAKYADYDFSAVDERARTAPEEAEASPRSLAAYLSEGARNDAEKARAIFIWLAEHIAYDGESYSVMDIKRREPEEVFLLRKGVCIDYSVLFEALCSRADLQARVITGHATGYPSSILLGDTRHAWNAVRLDGEWYLLDVTWSAGWLDDSFAFHRAESHEAYWLSPPEAFVRSHYPEDPAWQLLEPPLKWSEFMDLAKRGG